MGAESSQRPCAGDACRVRKFGRTSQKPCLQGRPSLGLAFLRSSHGPCVFDVDRASLIFARASTPFQAPKANAFAERWVGTIRRDCLDWILIVSRRQLEQVLRIYIDHYNGHRPHRALELTPPMPKRRLRPVDSDPPEHVHRRDRFGGLIHEYVAAA
jgi:hypothetical protein